MFWYDGLPIKRKRIALYNRRGINQRDTRKVLTEAAADQSIHLVIHQPQRRLCNLSGELFKLYAVKLIHIDLDIFADIKQLLICAFQFFNNREFQKTQLTVCNNQKISAAAGGIKKG